jgi:hypothetical protein
MKDISDGIGSVISYINDLPMKIANSIGDKIMLLFVPQNVNIRYDELSSAMVSRFPIYSSIHDVVQSLSSDSEPIKIDLPYGQKIDTSWFNDYRDTFRGYESGAMYLFTLFAVVKRVTPKIVIS